MVPVARSGGNSRSDCRQVMKITTPYELRALIYILNFKGGGNSGKGTKGGVIVRKIPPLLQIRENLYKIYPNLSTDYVKLNNLANNCT